MDILTINDEHKAREIDSKEKNKFKFAWLNETVIIKGKDDEECSVTIGDSIVKINVSGKVKCTLCADFIYYGSKGLTAIKNHVKRDKHAEKVFIKKKNFALPSDFLGNTQQNQETVAVCQNISLPDRVASLEAMLLGVLAQNNIPFTAAPVLINLSKAMASDKKALSRLSMSRTTASYKMKLGMAKTFFDDTINNLKNFKFSLNIDEATSTNKMRVLCILASYFCPNSKKVVIDHLASLSLSRVTAEQLFTEIINLFEKNGIPFQNLVSILMDSCSVMRGSKSGLETRIRHGKAPHLLDIDGDSCHHIHNSSKIFCKPFCGFVENFYKDLHIDFKWSADLCEKLQELCLILGTKYCAVEDLIKHRWLSVYDVTLSTLQMLDCFTVFYFCFLNETDRLSNFSICVNIYKQREVTSEGKQQIKDIHKYLKNKKLTDDGKKRKDRIVAKLFSSRKKLLLIMNFYASALPMLKKYVCIFQMKEPQIHKLYEEQRQLFIDFLSLFVKPEVLQTKQMIEILDLDFGNDCLLPTVQMYFGSYATSIISKKTGDICITEFLQNAKTAFIHCAKYLQKTLPLRSPVLKCMSAIDPTARGHHTTLARFKKLPELIRNVLDADNRSQYDLEVHRYQVDNNLPSPTNNGELIRIDMWWAFVFQTGKYPVLSEMVKAILSCFHGPQVESAFSSMSAILDQESGRMSIETLSALQTVKYRLLKSEKSAVDYFKRDDCLHTPVQTSLCSNLRSSYRRYKEELDIKNKEKQAKKEKLKILERRELSRKKAINCVKAAEKKLRLARKRKLEQMAEQIAKKRKRKS